MRNKRIGSIKTDKWISSGKDGKNNAIEMFLGKIKVIIREKITQSILLNLSFFNINIKLGMKKIPL